MGSEMCIRDSSMDLTLSTPAPERSGGLSPLLVELSDVLPSSLYQPEDIE